MQLEIDERLVDEITGWLKEGFEDFQERGWRLEGYVVGLSGGVDSAVTAALCKRAFPESTHGLILPLHSDPRDKEYAVDFAEKFDIPFVVKEISTAYDLFESEPHAKSRAAFKLKSQLRMAALYHYANTKNLLVCGTGDLDEMRLGYFTRWGDGACDLFPLGGLHKVEVVKLGELLGVPAQILRRPASPGFFPGQTAEEEMGFSYDDVYRHYESGEGTPELEGKIKARETRSVHKLKMPPVFLPNGRCIGNQTESPQGNYVC